jgi:superfamily II DNA or RNA helicase
MSVPPVLVRRTGCVVDVGMVDGSPMPGEFLTVLLPQLTYDHVTFLRGRDRIATDGTRRAVDINTRRLYDILDGNRLMTGFGFMPKIAAALRRFGLAFSVSDLTPPRAVADAYTPRWDLLNALELVWRPRQLECLQAIADSPGGIIAAPPAFGKTEIIGRLGLLYPHAKIAVITKRKDVAETIERRLHGYLPMVGYYGGGKKRRGRVSVFIAKSMHKAEDEYDFAIIDECHEIGADSFCEKLSRTFFFSRMFGLSACWDARADGTTPRLEYLFGPVIFNMGWQEATALGLIVPVQVRWLNINSLRNPCAQYVDETTILRHGIWCNDERHAIIAAAANKHGPDEQVLILVHTVEQAVMLGRHLPGFELCYDQMDAVDLHTYKTRGFLPEGYEAMTPQRRNAMRLAFEQNTLKKVIATDVWSTGVSFEQLGVLFRTDARGSEILDDQAPGRVVRTHAASGKEFGIVYDCWDMFDRRFLQKAQSRFRRYKQKGWTQDRPKILERPPT